MKKIVQCLWLALITASTCFAQDEMKSSWEMNPSHKIDWTGVDESQGLIYASSQKEITMYEKASGKILWTKEFKALAPKLKKVDELIPMWDAKVFFIFNRRMGGDMMAIADMTTGDLLWSTEQFEGLTDENIIYISEADAFAVSTKKALTFVKTQTGELMWSTTKFSGVIGAYSVNQTDGSIVMLNYKPSNLAALFTGFKNQLTKVNLKNGDVIWDQTYRGVAEKKVYTRESLARIFIDGQKVFLVLNGLQVYDYGSGKQMWAASYDETPKVKGRPANAVRYGIYGAVAEPIIDGNEVYVLDMGNKRSQYIKKYDLESGKLVWTSPEIKDARAIPNMYLINGVVVLQIGGTVEEQGYYKEVTRSSDGTTSVRYYYEKDYIEVKPFEVQGFDQASGKFVWDSERFRKGITNVFPDGNDLIVCSGKALYKLDAQTGKEKYEVAIDKDGISQANMIFDYHDNIVIVADKGVSIHKKQDGSLVKAAKYKRSTPIEVKGKLGGSSVGKSMVGNKLSGFKNQSAYSMIVGNSIALQTKGGDIAVYNLDNCSFKQIDARKNASLVMSDDGNYVYVFEGGGMISKSIVTKYNTK